MLFVVFRVDLDVQISNILVHLISIRRSQMWKVRETLTCRRRTTKNYELFTFQTFELISNELKLSRLDVVRCFSSKSRCSRPSKIDCGCERMKEREWEITKFGHYYKKNRLRGQMFMKFCVESEAAIKKGGSYLKKQCWCWLGQFGPVEKDWKWRSWIPHKKLWRSPLVPFFYIAYLTTLGGWSIELGTPCIIPLE